MSISNLICDSIVLLSIQRFESAMCLAMNALDATAQKEYPEYAGKGGHVQERFKKFVADHYDVISVVGTAGAICSAPGSHLGVFDPISGNSQSLEYVLYQLVRCGLTHEANLPQNTYFNEAAVFGKTPQGLSIPIHLAFAVILAVVGAKTNRNAITVLGTPEMLVMGRKIYLPDYWGNKAKVLSTLGVSATTGLQGTPAIGVVHGTMVNCVFGPNAVALNKGTIINGTFDAKLPASAEEGDSKV